MKKTRIRPISKKKAKEYREGSKLKKQLVEESEGLCMHCGCGPDERGLHLVHLEFLSHCGPTNRENCEVWCARCHFGPEGHGTEL